MSTVNEKMTALADEVRELSGTTGKLGIDDMTNAINTETQTDLIAQIQTALEGKAAGGTTSEDLDAEISEYTSLNAELEEVINSLPEAGDGSGSELITVNISSAGPVYYLNQDGIISAISSGQVNALSGIIFYSKAMFTYTATGEYINSEASGYGSFRFLSDGGTVIGSMSSGGGAG